MEFFNIVILLIMFVLGIWKAHDLIWGTDPKNLIDGLSAYTMTAMLYHLTKQRTGKTEFTGQDYRDTVLKLKEDLEKEPIKDETIVEIEKALKEL